MSSESQEFSTANPASTAFPGGGLVDPMKVDREKITEKPSFTKIRKKLKEFNGFQNGLGSGLGGVLGGGDNKEGMDTYKDPMRNVQNDYGIKIKKKKLKEDHVEELENGLHKLDSHSYDSIDKLMRSIAKKHGITGKVLHDDFKENHNKIPDEWIKYKK
jgi:hypothetical protein